MRTRPKWRTARSQRDPYRFGSPSAYDRGVEQTGDTGQLGGGGAVDQQDHAGHPLAVGPVVVPAVGVGGREIGRPVLGQPHHRVGQVVLQVQQPAQRGVEAVGGPTATSR